MPARKGQPKVAGRVKGTPNKLTSDVKAMILAALDKAGGAEYLYRQSRDNPGPFMALVAKILPKEMEVTGKDGTPLIPAETNRTKLALAMLEILRHEPEVKG